MRGPSSFRGANVWANRVSLSRAAFTSSLPLADGPVLSALTFNCRAAHGRAPPWTSELMVACIGTGLRGFKYRVSEALTLSTYHASVDLVMDRVRERKAEGSGIGGAVVPYRPFAAA